MFLFFSIWLIGAIIFFLVVSYYDIFDNPGDLIGFSAFWFLSAPVMLLAKAGDILRELGQEHKKRKEQKKKLRVVEEEKAKQLLAEAEEEAEIYYQELRSKSR